MEPHGATASSSSAMASSPAAASGLPTPSQSSRRKANPSITPRRFTRFWYQRQAQTEELPKPRSILGNLDSSAVNHRQFLSPQSLFSDPIASDPISPPSPTSRLQDDSRKRKLQAGQAEPDFKRPALNLENMPPLRLNFPAQASQENDVTLADTPTKAQDSQESLNSRRKATLSDFFKASRGGAQALKKKTSSVSFHSPADAVEPNNALEGYAPRPIRKFGNRGFEAQLLNREHGFGYPNGQTYLHTPAYDIRSETANFHSRSTDYHECVARDRPGNTIPFCLASANSAPVTAIGDEEGCVRFFNTTSTDNPAEDKVDAHFQVHDNAIWDMAFSRDDLRLATASGESGVIIDTITQTVAAKLEGGHWDSTRQIAWQKGQTTGNVLATSDKAGRIRLWDLRCPEARSKSFSTRSSSGESKARRVVVERDRNLDPFRAATVNILDRTHERTMAGNTSTASVTAIQWLPADREHLLLSASEAEAVVKLWDLRYIKPRRQEKSTPLASTRAPTSHAWRSYGITSLALSHDAARMYAVCKDNTVYAYSTAHLMLGHAPELEDFATKRRPTGVEGLGPLYGFKHDSFSARTFYVKCSIRQKGLSHSSDLLAVGSTSSSVMLFPTDERYLRSACDQRAHVLDSPGSAITPSRSFSAPETTFPIFRTGTPLIHGHSSEVTNISWTHDGKLVSASDDYIVRQWQENGERARHYRQVGDFGGERHMAGWADVGDDWDAEDDEE
ncbi:hypothetical protein NW767_006385 [Fusarium falciforme]|uniref:Lethal(2) denticleless protein n=1 Tax=Fusarium falciforme TaxID=195108 RepID=A0A9W8V0M5_9HYPO|nr:hypothetical protein NW755_007273 [Fusarium falciforme]KAJ4201848.1 hypothetical protein NW767_006385 [Fusarium falciforme]